MTAPPLQDSAREPQRRQRVLLTVLVTVVVAVPALLVLALVGLANRMARAPSVNCENNIKIIQLAARTWAAEAGTKTLPADWLTFTNELDNPKYLHCPADQAHVLARTWAEFTPSNCSYVLSSGVEDGTANDYVRCTYHHHVGTADGRVVRGITSGDSKARRRP